MNRLASLVALSMLVLTACAMPRDRGMLPDGGLDPRHFPAPTPCRVQVHVEAGNILIDHEPVRTSRCSDRDVWFQIVGNPTFPSNGVTLKTPTTAVTCPTQPSSKQVKCTFTGPRDGLTYPYTIRVNGAAAALDPMMVND